MDRLAITAFEVLGKAPAYLTFIFAIIILFVALYVYVKKLNVNEFTSIGNIQSKQTKLLMDQIEQLSKDLQDARLELRDLFQQNLELMKRISELEGRLADRAEKTIIDAVDINTDA
jgi:hypothetical protein